MRKHSPSHLSNQRGFFAVVAIILILIIGFLGVAIAYMTFSSANATVHFAQSENALDIAEAGFEETAHLLYTPILTGTNARIACASLSGNANLTNTSVGAGTFTATPVSGSPVYVSTTLSSAITNTATTIPVTSTTGFSPAGRIMIDYEVMNYGGISGNSFIGVNRGANNNYNTAHASGAAVSQYQCNIDVKGGIPNLTSPTYQREIQQSIQLQEGWAVGTLTGTDFVLTHWNRPTEVSWSSDAFSSTSAATLNSVSMLSNAEGWAVGNVKGSAFSLLHWNGSSWSVTTSPTACSTQNLMGVSSVSSQEAWAVGVNYASNGGCGGGGTRRYTVMKWNGTSWSLLTPTTIPADNNNNANLNAVHVIGTSGNSTGNLGFAVGNSGTILKYNGTTWTADVSGTTQNLFGVYVVSVNEAWAVGAAGVIRKWNGSTWSAATSPTATQLNAITMLDATLSGTAQKGWAVGNAGVAASYNGSSWSSNNTGSGNNMSGVAMFNTPSSQDVWVVGAAGTIMHYNGTSWASVTSGVTTALLGISLIEPQQFPFAWKEVFA